MIHYNSKIHKGRGQKRHESCQTVTYQPIWTRIEATEFCINGLCDNYLGGGVLLIAALLELVFFIQAGIQLGFTVQQIAG